MQIVNNIVSLSSTENRLFTFMALESPDGLASDQALHRMAACIQGFTPTCAIDVANLRILEKLYNTLAAMVGSAPIQARSV